MIEALPSYFPVPAIYKAKEFKKLVESTSKRRAGQSGAPGVLEHRVSPRLEWLVDLGCLSKKGLPKNSFTYRVEPPAKLLLDDLDNFVGDPHWAENVAISQWISNPTWDSLRSKIRIDDKTTAFLKAYKLLQRPIGPAPLSDVVFVSVLILASTRNFSEVEKAIIDFSHETRGVTLSGSRLQRTPQNIDIPDKLLQNIEV